MKRFVDIHGRAREFHERGSYLTLGEGNSLAEAEEWVHDCALRDLGCGKRYEVIASITSYGWRADPEFDAAEHWVNESIHLDDYVVVGRYVTPEFDAQEDEHQAARERTLKFAQEFHSDFQYEFQKRHPGAVLRFV